MNEARTDSTETHQLLQRIRAGDGGAFEELLTRHRPALHRFVAARLDRRLRSRLDPSDVVQETELEAFGRLPDFLERQPMPFHLWLRKTAAERLVKVRRQHVQTARRSVKRESPWPEQESLLAARSIVISYMTPSRELDRQEAARSLGQALDHLPENDHQILLLRVFETRPFEEIGRLLGLESAAARKRYSRALLHLRGLLADPSLEVRWC